MLLKVNNTISKKFLSKLIKTNNYFFVFNINDLKDINTLYTYFSSNILHSKQVMNFFFKKDVLNLFSGNTYFCFVDSKNFFTILVDLIHFGFSRYKLDLFGICYNNYFLNYNLHFENVLNCLFLNSFILFYYFFFCVNLFLLKVLMLIRTNLSLKKC